MYLHLTQTHGDIFALTPALSPRRGVGRAGARPYRVQSYRAGQVQSCLVEAIAPSPAFAPAAASLWRGRSLRRDKPRPSPPVGARESVPDAQERVPTESKAIVRDRRKAAW